MAGTYGYFNEFLDGNNYDEAVHAATETVIFGYISQYM